ncbi:MAG: carboxypeptidase regulatory-like domain-containing protein [bacterium]|nr:carboxypeptidase regulatory-like domain-containing protein [bacterium]
MGLYKSRWGTRKIGGGYIRAVPALLLVNCVIGGSGFAATISGEVYDVRNGTPIEGASLECYDSVDTSGEDGGFTLPAIPPGDRLIRVTCDGYAVYEDEGLGVPTDEELWLNIPMLPLSREVPGTKSDFLGFCLDEAKIIGKDRNCWFELPVTVGYGGGGLSYDEFEATVAELDTELGGGYLISGFTGETVITIASPQGKPAVSPGDTLYITGNTEEQVKQLRAALLLAFLNGRLAVPQIDVEKRYEEVIAEIEDYEAAVRVVYNLGPEFDFDRYQRRIRSGNAVVFSVTAGPAMHARTGWYDDKGDEYYLPLYRQMAGIGGELGVRVLGAVAYAGIEAHTTLFSAEGLSIDGLDIKEHSHSFTAYRGGVGYDLTIKHNYLLVRPSIGWERIEIKGEYKAEDPEDRSVNRDVAIKRKLSGSYGEMRVNFYTPFEYLGGYVGYRHIRADGFINYIDVGLGQARWRGFGVYLTWKQYWNDQLNYGLFGLEMTGEIGL